MLSGVNLSAKYIVEVRTKDTFWFCRYFKFHAFYVHFRQQDYHIFCFTLVTVNRKCGNLKLVINF